MILHSRTPAPHIPGPQAPLEAPRGAITPFSPHPSINNSTRNRWERGDLQIYIPIYHLHTCTGACTSCNRMRGKNEATLRGKTAASSPARQPILPREARPAPHPTARSHQQIRSEVGRATLLSGALQALPIPATDEVTRELAGAHGRRCRQAHTRCPGLLGWREDETPT